MAKTLSEEVYECAGCAGEVSVVEAVWLPFQNKRGNKVADHAKPYCCLDCYAAQVAARKVTSPPNGSAYMLAQETIFRLTQELSAERERAERWRDEAMIGREWMDNYAITETVPAYRVARDLNDQSPPPSTPTESKT